MPSYPLELKLNKLETKHIKEHNSKTLLYEVYNYSPIQSFEKKIREVMKTLPELFKGNPLTVVDNSTYVGIEVEVEGVKKAELIKHQVLPMWSMVADGSLRNNGIEFVSVPIRGDQIYQSLVVLDHFLKKNCRPVFSERTSVHVHMGVRKLNIEQLFVLILTYLIVEKVLFKFVEKCGFSRENNIFCSPITDSKYYLHLSNLFYCWNKEQYGAFLKNTTAFWKKYTAFNLLPLVEKGTLEFRHMGGILDTQVLMNWINLILSLKKFSYTTTLNQLLDIVENINTDSTYQVFLESVFKNHAPLLFDFGIDRKLEEGIISVKQCIAWSRNQDYKPETIEQFSKSSFGKYFFKNAGTLIEKTKNNIDTLIEKYENKKIEIDNLKAEYHAKKDGVLKKSLSNLINKLNDELEILNAQISILINKNSE